MVVMKFSYVFSLRLKKRIPEVWAPDKWSIINLDLEVSNIHIHGNSESFCFFKIHSVLLDRKTAYGVSAYTHKICYTEKQTRFWICIYVLYAQCVYFLIKCHTCIMLNISLRLTIMDKKSKWGCPVFQIGSKRSIMNS